MVADQPARVTPREIAGLVNDLAGLGPRAPLADRVAWCERKAVLLSQIAEALDTPEAYLVAADAWQQVAQLAAQAESRGTGAPR